MNCMKCGREISAGQVFCDSCLSIMEKYPVKPDTAVQLPRRQAQSAAKKAKRQPSPEEQILHWRKRYRRLVACLLAALLLLAAAGTAIWYLWSKEQAPIPMGRNYTIDPQG